MFLTKSKRNQSVEFYDAAGELLPRYRFRKAAEQEVSFYFTVKKIDLLTVLLCEFIYYYLVILLHQ